MVGASGGAPAADGATGLGGSLSTLATAAASASVGPERFGKRARKAAIWRSTVAGGWEFGPGRTVANGRYSAAKLARSTCSPARMASPTICADPTATDATAPAPH